MTNTKLEPIIFYGGGFKPPTIGHFDIAKQILELYPYNLTILVGSGIRNNVTQDQSYLIWDIYKKYLSSKVTIEKTNSPIKHILDYAKQNPNQPIIWVLGVRENNEEDIKDTEQRSKGINLKYPNIEIKLINSRGDNKDISGTQSRNYLLNNNKELFFQTLPNVKEKEQIWDILKKKPINKNITYSKNIDYKQSMRDLIKYIISRGENIVPLPKVKFINGDKLNAMNLLGKTAYYDPNTMTIVLYTEGRHPKDLMRSFCHEIIHHIQNLEGRLNNINTTNTNEDGDLPEIEREAYERGNMIFRNWEDSIKADTYLKEYKQYFLNELFEKDLPIIDKVSKNLYIVSNGNDIEAKYDIRVEIPERDLWSVNWFFTPNNKNTSPEAWKQVTATSFKILEDWLKTNNPKAIYISGNTGAKTKLYKAYVDKLQILLNNKYKIDNSDEDRVVLRSIEEVYQSSIKKRIETLNESYEQALNYWQNGDINSKSKIERWGSIKKKIEREVLQELYDLKKK
jgi:phosphopantetheine adenylyltransferase